MITALLTAILLAVPATALAQEEDAIKARLKSALDATSLKYEPSPSGLSLTVLFDHPNHRQQKVYVATASGKPNGMITHVVYTNVWVGASAPDEALLRKVLGQTKKLGTFYLYKDSKGMWAIRFGAHFNATDLKGTTEKNDPITTTLKDLIFFVNQVGEETDKAINGEKDIL